MIKYEIWARSTTRRYEGQEKLEQEIVSETEEAKKEKKQTQKEAWQPFDSREGSWVHLQKKKADMWEMYDIAVVKLDK